MYRTFLVAIDMAHGPAGLRLLRLAREIGGPEAQLTAIHVMDPVPGFVAAQIPEEVIATQSRELRATFEGMVADADARAKTEVRQGAAAQGILMAAEEIGADVILVASHRPGLRDYLMGSTAARVVRHATCSVIVDRSV